MTTPGDTLTLIPHDLSLDGGSVARHGELVVFLDKGLPGEVLRARIDSLKPRFATAAVIETITPSPTAEPAHCPHAGDCGGCPWPGFSYRGELAWKERQVRETLRRLGKMDFSDKGAAYDPIIPSPRDIGYRNKVEFAFGASETGPLLGMKRRASHAVVAVDDCPLAAASVRDILAHARAWAGEAKLPAWDGKQGYLRFLVVRQPDYAPEGKARRLVELITAPSDDARATAVKAFGESLLRACPDTAAFLHSERASAASVAYGERIRTSLGPDRIWERIGDVLLEAPATAFMQVNTGAAALLYAAVGEYAGLTGAERVWDLYSGIGGIALTLAGSALSVRGFENTRDGVNFAGRNAVQAGAANAVFLAGDVAALLRKERAGPDLVVTDPPRAGLDAAVTAELLRLAPPRLILVGCDPATLARDAGRLAARYAVSRARAIDMFPRTPHVETITLLLRRD